MNLLSHTFVDQKPLNPEIDVTRFINTDDESFQIYIGGKIARDLKAGEESIVPIYVAQIGAKHLVDRMMQKQGIRYVNPHIENPVRQSLTAKILPDLAERAEVKPLSDEDFKAEVQKRLDKQEEMISNLQGEKTQDSRVKKLEMELKMMKARLSRKTNKE